MSAFPETYLYLYIKTDEQLNETVSVRRFGVGPELRIDDVGTGRGRTAARLVAGVRRLCLSPDTADRFSARPGRWSRSGPDSNNNEPFLPADFSAWEMRQTIALDHEVPRRSGRRAGESGSTEAETQSLRLFGGYPRSSAGHSRWNKTLITEAKNQLKQHESMVPAEDIICGLIIQSGKARSHTGSGTARAMTRCKRR